MQNPYDRYQSSQKEKPKSSKKKPVNKAKVRPQRAKKVVKSKPSLNLGLVAACFVGLSLSFYILFYTDQFLSQVSQIQIGFTKTMAADGAKKAAKRSGNGEQTAALPIGKVSQLTSDSEHLTMKNASVFKALKDKSRELEKKERRLAQLEEDLQIQKVEIEKQLKEMTEMRRNISSKLDKKVVADQESINKLVGVYANMKPLNAAIIISQLDEQLAVKVLGKMKKQNAASILNYVQPAKAKVLSEKFTGLKK